jgi:hypothetical protein
VHLTQAGGKEHDLTGVQALRMRGTQSRDLPIRGELAVIPRAAAGREMQGLLVGKMLEHEEKGKSTHSSNTNESASRLGWQ